MKTHQIHFNLSDDCSFKSVYGVFSEKYTKYSVRFRSGERPLIGMFLVKKIHEKYWPLMEGVHLLELTVNEAFTVNISQTQNCTSFLVMTIAFHKYTNIQIQRAQFLTVYSI